MNWRPTASIADLRVRAALLARVRAFFAARGVLEVDTPLLGASCPSDPHVHSLSAQVGGRTRFLQSSPEYMMKRLLAAHSGPIYQICKAFRDDAPGAWHRCEFTLLEWYRPGFDHLALMDETRALIAVLLPQHAVHVHRYREVFRRHTDCDPWAASEHELRALCTRRAALPAVQADTLNRSDCLDLLFSVCVQPRLEAGVHFVVDYPACQSALARLAPGGQHAERFEVFVDGLEIGNAYHELSDTTEQRRRILDDNAERLRRGWPSVPVDECLLEALEHGLGDCAGIAMGLDRLFACALETDGIAPLMAFADEAWGTPEAASE